MLVTTWPWVNWNGVAVLLLFKACHCWWGWPIKLACQVLPARLKLLLPARRCHSQVPNKVTKSVAGREGSLQESGKGRAWGEREREREGGGAGFGVLLCVCKSLFPSVFSSSPLPPFSSSIYDRRDAQKAGNKPAWGLPPPISREPCMGCPHACLRVARGLSCYFLYGGRIGIWRKR